MSQPVWTLSVDLQTKTAAFTTGLADAAKGARQSFGDIRSSAGEMSGGVKGHMEGMDYSMTHARHGIHLMLEEMGIHMPRAVMSFLASLGPIGAAMEAAFPFLAIIVGVTLLIEHFHKLGEEEEKVTEAGRKLSDGFAERINKADQEIVKAEIEIRKLAGSPAWDLLNEKLRLEDAAKGLQNVAQLEKAVADLLKNAPTTTNWNPFNWFDGSGDVQAKAKALQEQMRGKSQSDQANIAQDALTLQSHILEQMKGQSGISEKQLEHQQKYVEFLKLETAELTRQADAAVLADQSQQGKDREDRIKKAEEEERKLSEARQRGLDHRQKVETEYAKKQKEIKAKAIEGSEHMQEMQKAAEDAFTEYQTKQMLERERVAAEMGREGAEHTKRMGELAIESEREQTAHRSAMRHVSDQQLMAEAIKTANAEYRIQMTAFSQEMAALDKHSREYEVRLKSLQNRQVELTRAHENRLTQIKNKAEEDRNARMLSSERQSQDLIARGLSDVLMRHQTFGAMLNSIGDQIASGMIQNAMKSIMANDMTKPSDAAHAARKAFLAGWHFPWPVNLVMGPALGAMAFAAAMAFEGGGIVPGVERGDVVPARLSPGEAVLPKQLTEGLTNAARGGSLGGGHTTHVRVHFAPTIHAVDATGVDRMLQKHGDKFTQHLESQLRKRNI